MALWIPLQYSIHALILTLTINYILIMTFFYIVTTCFIVRYMLDNKPIFLFLIYIEDEMKTSALLIKIMLNNQESYLNVLYWQNIVPKKQKRKIICGNNKRQIARNVSIKTKTKLNATPQSRNGRLTITMILIYNSSSEILNMLMLALAKNYVLFLRHTSNN